MDKKSLKRLEQIEAEMNVSGRQGDLNRSRSITVGTAFGGVTEVSMRRMDGVSLWTVLQPVEVVELIHQLAANIGCHIHVQPRKDFASWRNWKYTEDELSHFRGPENAFGVGHPPHVKGWGENAPTATKLPKARQQPGLQPALMTKDGQNETVAIEKTVNRRSTKRTTKAS
jgi:hypothetical protein